MVTVVNREFNRSSDRSVSGRGGVILTIATVINIKFHPCDLVNAERKTRSSLNDRTGSTENLRSLPRTEGEWATGGIVCAIQGDVSEMEINVNCKLADGGKIEKRKKGE